jgi:DNA polymerase III epsilon subunit-like protein
MKDLYWKKAKTVTIDLETTGLGSDDKIIQVGLVCAFRGHIYQQCEALYHPQRINSPGAYAVNGISKEAYDWLPKSRTPKSRTPSGLLQMILKDIDGIIVHNAGFDLRFVRALKDLKIERKIPYFCTLRRARQLGYHGHLTDIATAVGLNIDKAKTHRALYDAQIAYQLFKKITPDNLSLNGFFHGYL